ncbi:MAG: ATP-binding protein [Deltaproteobacteria bacterium]|nr:ATP-binding protein [Deltaproteobacteria bacterium]MBW2247470.1 ATP-binding protein [Deltaproteobacteria bacterium]MBW2598062.1 ATP-binding protein [Deltaproteobacteria bacterium]MBW2639885.1 ATP-binding protein [Deltaproteobacteria bacterium]MBW2679860.1 ATP-binding protein [Deltaproteobacteria bacterium]
MAAEKELISILDEHTIEVRLPNKLGYERIAMACSASFAKIVGFRPERIEDLKTAVSEACINAMEHGNKNNPDARVVITMHYGDHSFTVSVMDQGKGMGNSNEPLEEPDIEKKILNLQTPRGLGIFLIKQLVDRVEFNQTSDEGHMVRMVFRMTG